jgi:hypothetical protein
LGNARPAPSNELTGRAEIWPATVAQVADWAAVPVVQASAIVPGEPASPIAPAAPVLAAERG